jgi:methylenetetrahydrofolate reductase (NADPH)
VRQKPLTEAAGRLLADARFELVPLRSVQEELPHLPEGATVSVTWSPRRGLEPTLDLCEELAARGFRAVPHIAARQVRSEAQLAVIAERAAAAGIREIFVVGGDATETEGPFPSALHLLQSLDRLGMRFDRVGVAGYPEPHPLVDDSVMLRALTDKQRYAGYVVTQICYSADHLFGWIGRIRRAGIELPVYVGLPGAVRRAKLLEISLRIGVGSSISYLRRRGGTVARLFRSRTYRPDGFVAEVAAGVERNPANVVGFHINTFNQVESTERWRREVVAGATPRSSPRALPVD